jgi:hypothetical protein
VGTADAPAEGLTAGAELGRALSPNLGLWRGWLWPCGQQGSGLRQHITAEHSTSSSLRQDPGGGVALLGSVGVSVKKLRLTSTLYSSQAYAAPYCGVTADADIAAALTVQYSTVVVWAGPSLP